MSPLPISAPPRQPESASGYMLRVLSLNGAHVKEAMAYCRTARSMRPLASDAELFAELTGVPVAWFHNRLPAPHTRDRWREVDLFGRRWRSAWLLRDLHQQVCPVCLREQGIARLEWDLMAYPACHIHKVLLQDMCWSCGRAISPRRPSLEVCNCGGFIAAATGETAAIDPALQAWVAWLSMQLLTDCSAPQPTDLERIAPQVRGLSPDGAFRLIYSFAGGGKAFCGEQMLGGKTWLSSAQMAGLLRDGLAALQAPARGVLLPTKAGTPSALAEQAEAGVTAWDRAVAAREVRRLKLGRRWRNAVPRCPQQQELFEDSL
ncbi:TniQ family protein [Paucibacter sp. PLA-PC-4]|uniref:TniQ family protein n=1 Tax=Paucibacter sp. PLA-PC-4 TaxID=2993655 RepID=UPI00224A7ED4|nr:TniQ family protein [Paucibacter sp. PLA-PC-4]MCX2864304.1 TniQ family protein [Paucibacter sp. PLA-PC-4]